MGERADWSRLASWYDELLAAGSGPHETALATLLRLVPEDLGGADVIDVACGQGLAARALAEAGAASVVGVDSAPAMLEVARQRTAGDAPISWRLDDAERLATFGPASTARPASSVSWTSPTCPPPCPRSGGC
jgi:ubiquinone/menaquinone biosynthesis C-methylase UbiE